MGEEYPQPQLVKCHLVDSLGLKQFLTVFKFMSKLVVLFRIVYLNGIMKLLKCQVGIC